MNTEPIRRSHGPAQFDWHPETVPKGFADLTLELITAFGPSTFTAADAIVHDIWPAWFPSYWRNPDHVDDFANALRWHTGLILADRVLVTDASLARFHVWPRFRPQPQLALIETLGAAYPNGWQTGVTHLMPELPRELRLLVPPDRLWLALDAYLGVDRCLCGQFGAPHMFARGSRRWVAPSACRQAAEPWTSIADTVIVEFGMGAPFTVADLHANPVIAPMLPHESKVGTGRSLSEHCDRPPPTDSAFIVRLGACHGRAASYAAVHWDRRATP